MYVDLGQLVIDNQPIAMIRHFVSGVPVNDEALAMDVIHAVGAGGDSSHEHTLRHMADASQPNLFDRDVREEWQAKGGSDLATRARAEATRVLEHV